MTLPWRVPPSIPQDPEPRDAATFIVVALVTLACILFLAFVVTQDVSATVSETVRCAPP